MSKILKMALAFTVALAGAGILAARLFGTEAMDLGLQRNERARRLTGLMRPQPHEHPLVVWMGDSTIFPASRPSYPQLLAKRTDEVIEHLIIGLPGLDFFHHYSIMGRVLRSDPDVIVAVANLRLFRKQYDDHLFRFISAFIPSDELPRTLLLPLHARDLTVPRLLLNRMLLFAAMRHGFYAFEGLRALFREGEGWELIAPRIPAVRPAEVSRDLYLGTLLRSYDTEISARHPVVRMMRATVAMASRHGTRILVVACPIPVARLRQYGLYDEKAYRRRIDLLAATVRGNGGEFLDLHAELGQEEFSDDFGHYANAGAEHLARLIGPVVFAGLPGVTADGVTR